MLSKTQFVSLVDGMKKQSIFEQKVSTAFDATSFPIFY